MERLTLDMTVVRDATYEDRERHDDALSLLALAERGQVELGVPPQGSLTDLEGQFDGDLAGRLRDLLTRPGVVELPQLARLSDVTYPSETLYPGAYVEGFDEAWTAITTDWNGPGRLPGGADHWYAETHLHGERDVLLTDDGGLRTACGRLGEEHGLPVDAMGLRGYLAGHT